MIEEILYGLTINIFTIAMGQMCIEGEERIISSIPEGIRVIVANDLSASE
jgi:hypothetical protein